MKHKIKTCHGFPIIISEAGENEFKGLRDRYRGLCLIKNRSGDTEKYISTSFYGELGYFKELPKAEEISDFSQYLSLIDRDKADQKEPEKVPISFKYNF